MGNTMVEVWGIVVDGAGNAYVAANDSHNALRIPAALTPVELMSFAIDWRADSKHCAILNLFCKRSDGT